MADWDAHRHVTSGLHLLYFPVCLVLTPPHLRLQEPFNHSWSLQKRIWQLAFMFLNSKRADLRARRLTDALAEVHRTRGRGLSTHDGDAAVSR